MSNRAQRRAAQRRPPVNLAEFRMALTPDEAVIVEEALAWWIHETRDVLPAEPHPLQEWSLARAEKLRQGLEAALANRPWRDLGPDRDAPELDDGGQHAGTAERAAGNL